MCSLLHMYCLVQFSVQAFEVDLFIQAPWLHPAQTNKRFVGRHLGWLTNQKNWANRAGEGKKSALRRAAAVLGASLGLWYHLWKTTETSLTKLCSLFHYFNHWTCFRCTATLVQGTGETDANYFKKRRRQIMWRLLHKWYCPHFTDRRLGFRRNLQLRKY